MSDTTTGCVVRVTAQPRWCTINSAPLHIVTFLYDALSYLPASFNEYNSAFYKGPEAFMVRLFDKRGLRFPTGLLARVKKLLANKSITLEVMGTPVEPKLFDAQYDPLHPLRDYQEAAVERAVTLKRGLIGIPTSGGKTEVAADVIAKLKPMRTLYLVPSAALLDQSIQRLQEMFPDTQVIGWGYGKKPKLKKLNEHLICVAIANSASKAEGGFLNFLRTFDLVWVDEAHRTPSGFFKDAIINASNARYIFGGTATPFRNNNDELEMEAWIGPLIYSIEYETLIEAGHVVPPKFLRARSLPEALRLAEGKKTILFTEKSATLERYRDVIESFGGLCIDSKYKGIAGAINDLRSGKIMLLAATPLFDEGLNISDIEAIVLLDSCASPVRLIQRIGRALRVHPGKTEALIIDIQDRNYADRVKAYSRVPAFAARLGRK